MTLETRTPPPVNAALLGDYADAGFMRAALSALPAARRCAVISDGVPHAALGVASLQLTFAQVALHTAPLDPEEVFARLRPLLADAQVGRVVVDMGWAVGNLQGVTGLEKWGSVADRLGQSLGLPVVSVYSHDLIIEEQMQALLRSHRQFLSPRGLVDNPYWIPGALLETAPLDEQLSFMLGRVVPDYAGLLAKRQSGQMFARGATPSWLAPARAGLGKPPGALRWHIHCLGRLQVFVGNTQVSWQLPGGAPKKTRTLFAYLLHTGEKGAHADQIGELLWPEGGSEQTKRARLHHTVAMLRKTLGDPGAVIRSAEYYRLHPPTGSWIDIDTFEQLCRRGLSLFKRNEPEAAFRIYAAATELYGGDLFEDLPLEYVQSETDDWCMPRRIWLREMAVKLYYDFSKVCMKLGRTREALDQCQKALAIDPASEGANAEAMKIFVAQGRTDAMHRQYRQYRAALAVVGAAEGAEMAALCRSLSQPDGGPRLWPEKAAKEKPKPVALG
jgi:DNA-binding SARP family transcriptional activator